MIEIAQPKCNSLRNPEDRSVHYQSYFDEWQTLSVGLQK